MAASVLAAELGVHDLAGLVNVGDRSLLDTMMSDLTARVGEQAAREYGLEVAAVRLRRLNYPEEVRSAVFEQIRSERQRVAAATRAEGESQARVIRSARRPRARGPDRGRRVRRRPHDRPGRGPGRPHRQRSPRRRPRFLSVPEVPRNLSSGPRFKDDARPLGRQQLPPALDPGSARSGRAEASQLAGERERAHGDRDSRGAAATSFQSGNGVHGQTRPGHDQCQGGTKAMSRAQRGSGGFVLAVTCYLATGVTALQPDEVGIVRRFGAVQREPWEPGLHWGLPWGMDRVDRIKLNQTRTHRRGSPRPDGRAALARHLTLAPTTFSPATSTSSPPRHSFSIAFAIRPPIFSGRTDIEGTLSAISEWAMTRALANRGIDELLTTSRAEVALGLTRAIQAMADREGLGISIVAIRLGRVVPPSAVAPAFADAARARSDRRQAITRAEEYRDRARSEARGQAREIADLAAGRFDRLVQPARGEAARFTQGSGGGSQEPRTIPSETPPRDAGRALAPVPSHGRRAARSRPRHHASW